MFIYIYTYICFLKNIYLHRLDNIQIYIYRYKYKHISLKSHLELLGPRKPVEKQVSFWWGLVINLLAKNWRNTHSLSARVGCCQLHLARQGEMENAVVNQVSQGLQELIMWSYMVREMETSSFKWLSLWYYFLSQEFQVPKRSYWTL